MAQHPSVPLPGYYVAEIVITRTRGCRPETSRGGLADGERPRFCAARRFAQAPTATSHWTSETGSACSSRRKDSRPALGQRRPGSRRQPRSGPRKQRLMGREIVRPGAVMASPAGVAPSRPASGPRR